jgi:hypothetical protein
MDNTFGTTSRSVILLASIIGASFIVSSIIASLTFYNVRAMDNTLSSTGSAKVSVKADTAKWIAQFSRQVRVSSVKQGYAEMASDLEKVKKFYKDNGITLTDDQISQVYMDQDWNQNQNQTDKLYILRQTVTVTSQDVDGISRLSKNVTELINQGVLFQTQYVEYTYSKLPELRVKLLGDAIKDAKARADELAKSSGKRVGDLKSASSGVVQVLSKNSIDVADYGAYDTASIEKDVMVTAKATFTVD